MRKLFLCALMLCAFGLVACKTTGKTVAPGVFVTENVTVQLDEVNLLNNLAKHFSSVVMANAVARDAKAEPIPVDKFRIEEKQAVQLGANTYFAVKVVLDGAEEYAVDLPFPMRSVVDPSGNLVLSNVIDLRVPEEAILSRAPAVSRLDFPPQLVPQTIMEGGGTKDVIFVSDPFCGYCRKGYAYLSANIDAIRQIKLVHHPIFPQAGSLAAVWMLEYAIDENIRPAEVFGFTYSKLQRATPVEGAGDDGDRLIAVQILAQYRDAFPELFKGKEVDLVKFYDQLGRRYAQGTMEVDAALASADLSGTPVFVVDGEVISGLDVKALNKALCIEGGSGRGICRQ